MSMDCVGRIQMDKYICSCCGGRINRSTMTCEYCGTQYKEENDNTIRIETFTSPVRTFGAKLIIPDFSIKEMGIQDVSKYAVEALSKELAKAIPPMMKIEYEHDILTLEHKLFGSIKIIQPAERWPFFTKEG